ncbi:geranylgeranyl pyrophosphate synthase [Dichotomocladium elegans]|nr:geranylgeranyl pyrophosphate synthase [Dichotomocladium elegans]
MLSTKLLSRKTNVHLDFTLRRVGPPVSGFDGCPKKGMPISTRDQVDFSNEKILLEPYRYLCDQPGKDVRTKLIDAFDAWLNVPPDTLATIREIVQMLHTASLMIDDVQDDSVLRRAVPVAHHIFGVPQTINSANLVYFLALQQVLKLDQPNMVKIYAEELVNLHRGQGIELFWRDSHSCPTEEEYIEMVNNKTSGLFRLAVRLMQEASKSKVDYTHLVNLIGVHFQIRDDYMNLQSDQYSMNKGFCEDLTEGKFSFPIIHAIRTDLDSRQLLNIVNQRTSAIEVKQYALQIIARTGTFKYVREFLKKKELEALKEIERLGGNPLLEKVIESLSVPTDDA